MRIPRVLLGREKGLCPVIAQVLAAYPFQQFVQRRCRKHERNSAQRQPAAPQKGLALEQFPDRQDEQKAVAQMHQTIELVALPAHPGIQRVIGKRTQPSVIGNLGIGEMRA